jgi:hypothetical protein
MLSQTVTLNFVPTEALEFVKTIEDGSTHTASAACGSAETSAITRTAKAFMRRNVINAVLIKIFVFIHLSPKNMLHLASGGFKHFGTVFHFHLLRNKKNVVV